MKISAVSTIVLQLPFRHVGPPLLFAGKPRTTMEMLLVRVDTDAGITGWGEAFGPGIWPATRATIETLVAPLCIGRDPSQIQALGEDLQRKLHALGRSGSVMYALSGLDIALWDIAGKKAELPVCRLLSPAPKRDLPAYACNASRLCRRSGVHDGRTLLLRSRRESARHIDRSGRRPAVSAASTGPRGRSGSRSHSPISSAMTRCARV